MLKLFNTLTRKKELFTPLNENLVTMYNCGPTVYDYAHLGNLRGYVNANLLRRVLEHEGYEVKQIINITDVGHLTDDGDDGDDKIEKGALREKKTVEEIIEFYTNEFLRDLTDLNINTKEIFMFPRASQHIEEQIALIKVLESKGYTYKTSDGIYFDTSRFPEYGDLARLDIEGLRDGARVEANPDKRNVTDFALWKFSSAGEKRAQEWDSPWGTGFPGWHIECSAMAMRYLGETLDIHTGGVDHIPVHHTNEIAQSVCATGKPFSRFWLHHEFVNVKDGKMAKSGGNFIRLQSLREKGFRPVDYRYLLLLAHYRSPITFSFESLEAASRALSRLVHIYAELENDDKSEVNKAYSEKFFEFMNDDLNSPAAIATMWNMLKDDSVEDSQKYATLELFDSILGLGLKRLSEDLFDIPEDVLKLARQREREKKIKNYERADEIRDKISELGFTIKDTKEGFEIERA